MEQISVIRFKLEIVCGLMYECLCHSISYLSEDLVLQSSRLKSRNEKR